jgi:outer membrane receptor protein involved in Fe transport
MKALTRSALVLGLVLLAGVAAAFAQTITSQLTGTVTTGGSPLPGATVTISSPQMQGTRTDVTGNAGGYNFPGIPPGEYKVKIELSGMQSVTQTTRVGVGQTGRADADLKVSAVSDIITVTAAQPTVLETSTVSQNLGAKLVDSLPTNRTVLGTALLAPGVNANTPSTGQLSISGSPGYDNLVMVNGVVITEEVRGQALSIFIEDAIQETTIMTGAISAEYGRFTGGVVNSITKSGGNEFSGSFRENLSNPTWTARTPGQVALGTRLTDQLGHIHQETLGGYLLKDRLWFFGAGRQTKSDLPGTLRAVPGAPSSALSVDTLTNEKRIEGKLTGQITSKHNLAASYLDTDAKQVDSFFSATAYGPEQLVPRHDPQRLETANYNGVLTSNWLLEGLVSKMDWGVAQGSGATASDFVNGTLVRNRADANARFNSATFCGVCDKETRSNDSWTAKSSYFLSTKNLGNSNIVGGVEQFREHRHSNNFQSGSNFRFFVNSVQFSNNTFYPTVVPGTANSSAFLVWTPILTPQQGESNLATNSAFVNDKWDLNDHWSFNVGVRYDKNNAVDGSKNTVSNDSKFTPRLSASYDLSGNGKHKVTASYGQYASRIVDGPGTAGSSAGNPGYVYYKYLGPAINPAGTPTNQLIDTHAALAIVNDWFTHTCDSQGRCGTSNTDLIRIVGPRGGSSSVPGFDTRISSQLASPYVNEMTLGYGAAWFSNFVTRVDLVARDWKNFYAFRVDQTTPHQLDPLGLNHDVAIVQNTNDVHRKYRGAQFQMAWRPRRFSVGLNYTYSTLKGNDEQESATSGTVGNSPSSLFYHEILGYSNYQPDGYLLQDERHRARGWVAYDLPLPAVVGNVNLAVLQNFDSGLPYSAVSSIDLSSFTASRLPANSNYLAAPVAGQYYFGGRGAFRLGSVSSTNLALNYERPIAGRIAIFGHLDYLNVFNRTAFVGVNNVVNTAETSSNFLPFNPYSGAAPIECPQGTPGATCKAMGANFQKGASFGLVAGSGAVNYQQTRSWSVNAGLRF